MTLTKTISDPNGGTQIAMTADEEAAFLAGQAASTASAAIADLKSQAQTALNKTDLVALRCLKAGVSFPSEWQTYVTSLRSIASSGTGSLPDQPPYPIGT